MCEVIKEIFVEMELKKKTTRINSTIESKLEKEFRKIAFVKFGFKKGSIQNGLEEAIEDWIKKQKRKVKPLVSLSP